MLGAGADGSYKPPESLSLKAKEYMEELIKLKQNSENTKGKAWTWPKTTWDAMEMFAEHFAAREQVMRDHLQAGKPHTTVTFPRRNPKLTYVELGTGLAVDQWWDKYGRTADLTPEDNKKTTEEKKMYETSHGTYQEHLKKPHYTDHIL